MWVALPALALPLLGSLLVHKSGLIQDEDQGTAFANMYLSILFGSIAIFLCLYFSYKQRAKRTLGLTAFVSGVAIALTVEWQELGSFLDYLTVILFSAVMAVPGWIAYLLVTRQAQSK